MRISIKTDYDKNVKVLLQNYDNSRFKDALRKKSDPIMIRKLKNKTKIVDI